MSGIHPIKKKFSVTRQVYISDYRELNLPMVQFAYYNSSNASYDSTLLTQENSTAGNLTQFVATRLFFKNQLPVGTLIILKEEGYQYRPEGWTALDATNYSGTRPTNVSTTLVEATDSWWGSWNYRAFNISKNAGGDMTESEVFSAADAFAIFVPKN